MKITAYGYGLYTIFFETVFKEAGIAFIQPAPKGNYTKELGNMFSDKKLNEGKRLMLGSFIESFYLGADTAMIIDKNSSAETERIFNEIFRENGFKMKAVSLKMNEELPSFAFNYRKNMNLKKKQFAVDYFSCLKIVDAYKNLIFDIRATINNEQKAAEFKAFCKMVEEEASRLNTLSALKIFLRLNMKKAERFRSSGKAIPLYFFDECGLDLEKTDFIRQKFAEMGFVFANIKSVSAEINNKAKIRLFQPYSIKSFAGEILEKSMSGECKGIVYVGSSNEEIHSGTPALNLKEDFGEEKLIAEIDEFKAAVTNNEALLFRDRV